MLSLISLSPMLAPSTMLPIIIAIVILSSTPIKSDYWSDRADLLTLDGSKAIGSAIHLTAKEQEVNQILMQLKLQEYDDDFFHPEKFLPAIHFFQAKQRIEQSDVFKFIQGVPKGASLHSHDTAMVSLEYLYNLTYSANLFGCVVNERLKMRFFQIPNADCDWKLLKTWREDPGFDAFLQRQLSLIVDDPAKTYPDINKVWSRFMDCFATSRGIILYRPVFEDYFYQVLLELYEDNVMYLEFRGILPSVYELNGTVYSSNEVVGLYISTLERFKKDHPDFHGARFIYAPVRNVDTKISQGYVKTVLELKNKFPDFVAGFDLVGQEDKGQPLVAFVPQLLEIASKGVKFFFHAAETNWNGASSDLNLFDAVLLNTTRIGHGFGVVKHPEILELMRERDIAIEVSPISNQVLKLVKDLRNHPAAFLFAEGYPVVITSDDPTFWGSKGLSYDWYLAFMAFASRQADLRVLKQLAINSLIYSAMEQDEKIGALQRWDVQWDQFLNKVLEDYKIIYLDNAKHTFYVTLV